MIYKNTNMSSVRVLPNSKEEFKTEKEFKAFVCYSLIKRGGKYFFKDKSLNIEGNTLILFQYDGKIMATGIIEDKMKLDDNSNSEYTGYYEFNTEEIFWLGTSISATELSQTIGKDIKFSQAYHQIDIIQKDAILSLIDSKGPINAEDIWPKVWKMSHGELNDDIKKKLLDRKVIAIGYDADNSQGRGFRNEMKKGDLFYLTLGGASKITLLGRVIGDVVTCPDYSGWVERSYEIVKESNSHKYCNDDTKKGWDPSFRSTCKPVSIDDYDIFEQKLLKPIFDITMAEILTDNSVDEDDEKDSLALLSSIKNNAFDKLKWSEWKQKRNIIVYGAPGTGKSFYLEKERKELLTDCDESQYERVTFHQDYSYASFVGTYKPVPSDDDSRNIVYKYVPGPFMRVLVQAMKNPDKPYLLIVEEINRANTAAVFGDLFQLLDRNNEFESEYEISVSKDLKSYLDNEADIECVFDHSKIKLPGNFFIWATMNTADQGVFPVDTAFKRRWNFRYIDVNDGEKVQTENGIICDSWFEINNQRVFWNDLRYGINDILATDVRANEDKLLGTFFVKLKSDVDNSEIEIDDIKYKVLMYLFDDVARQRRSVVFAIDTMRFSEVLNEFDEKGLAVFSPKIIEKYNEYSIQNHHAESIGQGNSI